MLSFPLFAGLSLVLSPAHGAEPDRLFPAVPGWALTVEEMVYTPENLWDLIDGAAELFLSYGFTDLNIAEYQNGAGTDVRVELYRHNSRANAFGIYSQERNPEYRFIDLGTQAYIEDGVLNFLSGIYYIKVSSHRTGTEGRDAMTLVAQTVDAYLHQQKGWPSTLSILPSTGKQPNTEAYIAQDFLGYKFLHSAFVAGYNTSGRFQLFAVEMKSPDGARQMLASYLKTSQQPDSPLEEGMYVVNDPHNGTVHLLWHRNYLCGVVNCANDTLSIRYINEFQANIAASQRGQSPR